MKALGTSDWASLVVCGAECGVVLIAANPSPGIPWLCLRQPGTKWGWPRCGSGGGGMEAAQPSGRAMGTVRCVNSDGEEGEMACMPAGMRQEHGP